MGYLRSTDRTVYSADQLLWEAKKTALEAHALPRPAWTASVGPLIGMIDREFETRRAKGLFSEYDEIVGGKIRQIVARSISYEDALVRERTEFVDLCGRALTQARIRHMLENKKPLRN
jgi:3-hydroxyacyl-CoA dehydrogenase